MLLLCEVSEKVVVLLLVVGYDIVLLVEVKWQRSAFVFLPGPGAVSECCFCVVPRCSMLVQVSMMLELLN